MLILFVFVFFSWGLAHLEKYTHNLKISTTNEDVIFERLLISNGLDINELVLTPFPCKTESYSTIEIALTNIEPTSVLVSWSPLGGSLLTGYLMTHYPVECLSDRLYDVSCEKV